MNARIASACDGLALRPLVAVDVFRWNLRFGIAVSRRDTKLKRRRRPRTLRLSDVPERLREDIGLPTQEKMSLHDMAIRFLFFN